MTNNTVAIIPIKEKSERIKGKNFVELLNRPLYTHIITHALDADCFDRIIIDTDSEEISEFAESLGLEVIPRLPNLATNTANGNDLLNYHRTIIDADFYFQLFATAPFLQPETIAQATYVLKNNCHMIDSIFTAIKKRGWFWVDNHPVNYRPYILPRLQDAKYIVQETTGLYGITADALTRYQCRIGEHPHYLFVEDQEAIDIGTYGDLHRARIQTAD